MCKSNNERRNLGRKIFSWLSLGVFISTQTLAIAAPIMPDNNAHITERPLVQETANHIPLVNITAPTSGGVSMNKYDQFNVEQQGAILNNSYVTSKTELAGFVQGNANMINGTAKVIVNQVTSDKPTAMDGYLEVAGQRASVVVANPNGIAVNGGGFLNTSNAVLTTGKPELDPNGNLQNYRVEQGRVSINGNGLDGRTTDSVAIMARAIDINAGVWGNKLETRTGQNDINATTLEATSIESNTSGISTSTSSTSTEPKPQIGLDVSAVGGMYANHITMVGTESGVGVNLNGVVAGTQSVSVDANGNLQVNGTLQSDKQLSAKANSITNTKTIASGGTLAVDTQDLTNTGTITSAGDGHIKVSHTLDNKKTIAAGANTEGAITNSGSLTIEAGTLKNTDAVIVSGGTTKINGKEVHNTDNGRIYGGKVNIAADRVENRKNVALEAKLADAMKDMKAAEDALEAAYAVDTTAFKTKAEQDAYLLNIKEKYEDYDVKLAAVKAVQDELANHKGATIAGKEDVTIVAKDILNAEKSLIYSGNTSTLIGENTLHNHGGTIDGLGKGILKSNDYKVTNSSFTAKRVSEDIERGIKSGKLEDMLTKQENQIRIDDAGHSESGQVFKESEFDNLGSGYGANHTKGTQAPMIVYDPATYEVVTQITDEERAAGEEPIPDSVVGTLVPTYDAKDPIFETFGIKSLDTKRPDIAGPEQDAWDAQFKPILATLNDKIKEHNAKAVEYNKQIKGVASEKIDRYTIIRTQTLTSNEEVKNSTPGVVRFGGDVEFEGKGLNENSQMAVGGVLKTNGVIDQVSKKEQEQVNTFGTTQASYTYKRKFPHKSRRRGYHGELFMMPQIDKSNESPLGVAKFEDKDSKAKEEVGSNHRKEVQDFLNPFAQDGKGNTNNVAKDNVLELPTSSLYQIHPESTANYLVETDPQFTNKKKFLSSDYMYREMKTKPELVEKRLGDGLYEQTLIREQIVNGTGFRYLDGFTDDEAQFKALMDAGVTFAKEHNLIPGVALTQEQLASLTSDMVWLETATVMVDGQPVKVVYPKVYLKNANGLTLKADGTLLSANKVIMNAKEAIRNEGLIQGKTVILNSDAEITNAGHINGNKIGLQSQSNIHQQGQIKGQSVVELQAKKDINFTNTVDRLANQDVLNTTSGIAVTDGTGVMVITAGHDVNLGGATIEALGKEGAVLINAGNNVNSTTDTLSAKKDMTQNGDNYLRTYRKTELGTTIEAGGNVSVGAKNDVNARNLTISSDSGAVKVIGEHDVNIENGYAESKDSYAIKYKEKGFLSKKETKIKTNDESKIALMSTISGNTVLVGANNDVNLTSTNVVSTEGTDILGGHNVHTDAAEEYSLSEASKEVKKSGIMSAGMGIMIGKKQSKDNYRTEETTHKATTLGATNGKVTVQAGDTTHLTTTDIVADKGITLSGQDIILDGKENTYKSEEVHEQKTSGLTISVGGSVASAINTAYGLQQKAKGRQDKRLAALDYVDAGKELKTAAKNINAYTSYTADAVLKKGTALTELGQSQVASAEALRQGSVMNGFKNTTVNQVADYREGVGNANIQKGQAELADLDNNQEGYKAKKRAKADSLFNVKVSVGSSSSRSVSSYEANTYDGGSLTTNGEVTIEAKSADAIKGNIKAIGESITGKQVNLIASNDISLEAATNTSQKLEDYKSKGWSVGANISVNGGGIIGLDASANAAKQKGNTVQTSHTGTTVVGSESVHIESGKNTNLVGSKVSSKTVNANIGGNLHIESLQDTNHYIGESSSKGFSISTNGTSLGSISASSSKNSMNSNYASVTEEAGFYAGEGGFKIQTGDTTSLKGAVVSSTAKPENNSLNTGKLKVEDIENTAEYSSKTKGMSYNKYGNFDTLGKSVQDALWNTKGLLPQLQPEAKDDASSTTKSAISNGTIQVREQAFNMEQLSRDTAQSLNKLDEIFDKKKIEERQELSQRFAKEAFGQLHNWNPTTPEGKAAKSVAHGIVAEITARIAGSPSGSGFYAGATNEALIGEIDKLAKGKPDVAQWLSAGVGAMVNAGINHPVITGATVAQDGTKWNLNETIPEVRRKLEVDYASGEYKNLNPNGKEWKYIFDDSGENGVIYNHDGIIIDVYKEAGPGGTKVRDNNGNIKPYSRYTSSEDRNYDHPEIGPDYTGVSTSYITGEFVGRMDDPSVYTRQEPEWYAIPRMRKWMHKNFVTLIFPLSKHYNIVENHSYKTSPAIYWMSRGINPRVNELDEYSVAGFPIRKSDIPFDLEMRARYIYNAEHSGDLNLHETARTRDLQRAAEQIFRKNNIINDHDPLKSAFRYKNFEEMTVYDIKNVADKKLPSTWLPINIYNGRLHIKEPLSRSQQNMGQKPIIRLRVDPANTDKVTPYAHVHINNREGQPLNKEWKPVDRRSPEAHIRIKEDKK